jgi:hypothetical protein
MATKVKFEINFVNKASKVCSQLRDGLRVIQWQQFKTDYKDYVGEGKEFATNFELYAAFAEVWNAHPVQTMNVDEIKAFIDNLGYSLVDINQARSEYYERRNSYTATIKADVVSEEIPY